jgi:hypothetical protein
MINNSRDLVTAPSKQNLSPGNRHVYWIDGHPHFPQDLDTEMFFPEQPDVLSAEFDKIPVPTLTRSDREIDDSNRRRKLAISHRGLQRQRHCMFQLPKLMVSQIFTAYYLWSFAARNCTSKFIFCRHLMILMQADVHTISRIASISERRPTKLVPTQGSRSFEIVTKQT